MTDTVDVYFNYGGEWVKIINLFVVDEVEATVLTQSILHHTETFHVDVEVVFENEHIIRDYDFDVDASSDVEYDFEGLEVIIKQRRRVVNDRLENFKELDKGITFKDIVEARWVVNYYAIANGYGLKIEKTDPTRARYICDVGCPFRCYISRDKKTNEISIKNMKAEHNCSPCYKNPRVDAKTLAQYFKNKLQNNPKYTIKDMRGELKNDFKLNVTRSNLKRAKVMILEKLDVSFKDEYNTLEAYGQELRLSNPGSDVAINISKDALEEGKKRFLRLYICFQALKLGFKSGLRPLIGLDGTFLKGKCKGQLLVAMKQSSMNQFYPLAWAVVDKETSRTWSWFVKLLKRSLDLNNGA
uniref:Protein FAR1-RELATED SEQUENCE n=1 Tax=Nicotiana tabacum TaxID=4097 RepID=A0A1S4ANV0_TOBAC|nr:PREDICTED: uncharacterized protein LOC107799782 [Nicotiana tabacum]